MSIYKSGKNFNKSKKGISLIVLLITIIVMLILASAVVLYSLNNRSVDNANKVKIKSDIAAILDDYNNYNYKTLLSNASTAEGFDKTLLSADSEDVSYNGETLKGKKISDILPSIKGTEYEEKVYIKEGIIYIDGKDYSEEEIGWMIEQGINVLGQTDKVQVKFMESNVVVAKGFTKKLDVAYDLDNSSLSYSSEDEKIAKVDNKGNVTGINEGSTKITVTAGDVSDTCTVTVTGMSYAVTGIKLNKDKIVLPKGESETLVATISPLNATNKNVSWKSDDNSIASVDENGKVTANASGETVISATSEDGDKVATCKVIVDVKVEGLTLDKKELILELKEKSKLNATITPDDATNQKVKFRSSDKNIVTVDDKGNVIALLPGKASIVAESYENSDIYDICEVIVNFSVDSVKLNKDELILLIGETEKLNAVVLPDEASDKRINWNSSDSKVATVDDEGNVRAVSSGSTTITATSKSGNKSASCTVTVGKSINSFSVNPTSLTIKKGQKATITPVITPSDLTNTGVVFESLNNDIATIDNNGNIVGKNIGSTTVVATSTHDLSKTARCNVTVTNPITITASINNLAGKSCDLSINSSTTDGVISNIIVNLKESSESVYRNFANISDVNKNSDTRSINFDNLNIDTTYNVEIIVKTDKGETNTLTTEFTTKDIIIEEIKLNKATTKLAIGQSEVLDATILPDGAKNDLVWSSSNSSAVSVENNGKITGTGIGTSNITVKSSSHPDISATCSVTVVSPINITASQISNTLNSINLRIDALTTVGILSNVTVSYRSENDSEYTSSTTASPNQVTYTNESLSITGLTENSVYDIRVVASNNLNYSKTINLKCSTAKTPVTSITVSPSTTSLNIGQTTSLTASVLPTTASNKSYTWSSGNTDVATVNSSGLVTAVKEGTALITATSNDDNNIKGTCVVNVKEPITLSSSVSSYTANSINISISASTTSGNIQSIKVYTKETTNSSYTLKTTLSPNAASYSSTYNITGLSENTTYDIKIEATTTTSYTKTYEYEAATNKIVITSITLNKTNIALRTSSTSISGINTSEQLTATVNPSTVVNKEVIWSSADSNVAEVSQSGLVTAKSTGQTTITVKSKDDNSKTATCDVIVNPVAKVDDSKYYLTLQSAFNVATSSSTTIELLRSTSETLTFASGKVATLKTGSSSNIITGTLTNNGNLTIGGSGTITSTSSNTVTNNSSGTLTLNSSVQVKNTGANGRAIYNSGTVTIDGATITKTGSSYEAIYNYSGNLTMKSGTVSTEGSSSNAIEISSGTVTVNGGNVSSNYSSPTVLINGSNAIFNLGDKSKTLSETPRVKNTYKSSTAYGVQRSSGTFNFGNGSVVGYNEAISGTITVTRTSAKVLYKKSENTETATLGTAVAQIGNKYYAKLQDAFDVASSSTSITLLKDTAETLTFASGKSATLSTGTYTITGTLTNNGTLTISGSGTITNSTSSSTITNSSGSSLTLNTGVTIKNTSTGRTIYNSGTVTISGATVAKTGSSNETIYNNSGTLTMSSGTVSTTGSNSYAIDVNAGTVNVTGGTVSSNYSSSATIYINGGIFNLGTNASPCVSNAPEIHNNYTSGTAYGVYKNSGTFNFYDGKVIGYNFAIYNGINGVSSTYTGYAVLLSKSNSVETATLVEAVAKIGSKYYAKLQEAFDASSTTSSSPSSIYLLKSFSESSTFATSSSSAKYANLYLSNYTLTGTLTNYGSLSVYGNGTITNSTSSSIITNSSSGKLTLNSGVTIKNTSTGITITNSSSGTVIISGATVTKTNSSNETIYNNGGTLSMSSGTISATGSNSNAIKITSGTVTLTGGTISNSATSTYATIYMSSGTLNLGDSTSSLSPTAPQVKNSSTSGTAYGIYKTGGNFYFYNGSVVGYYEALYGNVNSTRSSYKVVYSKSGNVETAKLGTAVAHISSKYFATLGDAFSYVTSVSSSSPTRIDMDSNYSGTTTFNDLTSSIKCASLYLNGHTISASSSSPVITNNENLKVYGTGTISNSSGNAISNIGTLTVTSSTSSSTSPTIKTSSTSYAAVQNTGTITVSSGTISSTGTSGSTNYGVNNSATNSSLTINSSSANITYTNTNTSSTCAAVCNYGNITMSAGNILGNSGRGISQRSGTITITGGEVSGNYGISPYTSNCGTVTLGTNDTGVPNTTSPRIYGKNYAMTSANSFTQLNFYDGKVEFSKEMAEYGTPINPKPGDSSYTNPIKTPSGYSILLSSDKTTYTLGKLTPITDTTKIKPGIVINYPTLSNSVSITNSEYKTGIIEAQTFSTNGSKIKCVVIRNTNNVVEIVPLEGQYLALYSYVAASNDDKKFDTIANIYHNPTYSENSYHIGSPKRTTYTTEQDANAIYNVYKDNKTDFSSIYPKSYRYNYYSSRYAEEVNLNSSDWALESYQYFWTREYYEYPAWGVYAYYVGNSDGKYESYWLSDDEGSGAYDNGLKARIMPIISLKTTIGITGGNGTINSPYELGA